MYKFIQTQSELDDLIPRLAMYPSWGFDLETDGLDPHVNRHILAQIGRREESYIIDTRKVNLEPLRKPFFENEKIMKIGHNLKFDYKFMRGTSDMKMEHVRDTFLAEKVLSGGLTHWLTKDHKLDKVLYKRLAVAIPNKEDMQKSFVGHKGDFSKDQLDYAIGDVIYMNDLLKDQVDAIKSEGLAKTFILECDVMPAFGDMEYDGMKINAQLWRELLERNIRKQKDVSTDLANITEPFVGRDLLGEININYGSPKQIVNILQAMKIRVKTYNRETRIESEGLVQKSNKDVLKQLSNVPFVVLLGKWRSLEVRINTFGESYINAINPKTGCIHPNFWQIGTGTGRPSAGESDVNPLNIPKEQEYRSCFNCEEDEVVESDDYSGCESRILAHNSGDKKMLGIFQRGEDIHCGVATEMYGILVTKKNENKHLRTPAKQLNFGISYGQGPNKFFDDLHAMGFPITRDGAKKLYDRYCVSLKTAVDYVRGQGRTAAKQGYLENLNGRRRYWKLPVKEDMPYQEYKSRLASIEREGGNFAIQSVNADITKEAMIRIRRYAIKNKVRTKFINAIYDEIVTRTHKDDSPSFHEAKLRIMREAGEKWITTVPMLVDGSIGKHWLKD